MSGYLFGCVRRTSAGISHHRCRTLYIDASDWGEWHYIDFELLDAMSKNDSGFNTSSLWESYSIPTPGESGDISSPEPEQSGIYTYWYDVFGEGVKNHEYRGFMPTGKQIEPEKWTIAVHRNNVRTNGCGVYKTTYTSIDSCPTELEWLEKLEYQEDEWNETDVWAVQDKMLLGIIGCQGIYVNNTLSGWLSMEIPPMPPTFIVIGMYILSNSKTGHLPRFNLPTISAHPVQNAVLR